MKKKVLSIVLVLSMLLSIAACGGAGNEETTTAATTTAATTTEVVEVTTTTTAATTTTTAATTTTTAATTTKATTTAATTTKATTTSATTTSATTTSATTTSATTTATTAPAGPSTPEGGAAIKTAADFAAMKPDGEYYLANDITIDATWNNGVAVTTDDVTTYVPFTGSFDGKGFTITTTVALFAHVQGTVKNFTVVGEIAGRSYFDMDSEKDIYLKNAAVCMYTAGTAVFEDITNKANILDGDDTGAILAYAANEGSNVTVKNCVNDGNISARDRVGGIVGCVNGDMVVIDNCVNNGEISSQNYCGGIIGRFGENTDGVALGDKAVITNCKNTGKVLGIKAQVAGILGYLEGAVEITNCVNEGYIENFTIAGGILGKSYKGSIVHIVDCTNRGDVITTKADGNGQAGGIAAYPCGDICTITNCVNEGAKVESAYGQTGGIVGYSFAKALRIENCTNKASVYSGNYCGGVIGRYGEDKNSSDEYACELINCENYGEITAAQSQVGGMSGYICGSFTADGCVNYGKIINKKGVAGGIFGSSVGNKDTVSILLTKCINYGTIEGVTGAGGIAAKVGNEAQHANGYHVENCVNFGSVNATNASGNIQIGGIAGYAWGGGAGNWIKNCVNVGEVTANNVNAAKAYVGAFIGYVNSAAHEISGNYNFGQIYYFADMDTAAFAISACGYNKNGAPAKFIDNSSIAIDGLVIGQAGDPPATYEGAGKVITPSEALAKELNTMIGAELFAFDGTNIVKK